MSTSYQTFLEAKAHLAGDHGFDPVFMPEILFPFQSAVTEWAIRKGRAAEFADCGLGKTFMQLTFAENVHRHTGRRVLLLTPLAVGAQTVEESEKLGVYAQRSRDGHLPDAPLVVANYQMLHKFRSSDFAACVCDESSILKNVDGITRAAVTEFMRKMPFRLLCTATAAPNDFIELGTSSEALGELGQADMLAKFFRKAGSTTSRKDETRSGIYRFRGHAEQDFWRWVCSWARAIRKPSDLGFSDAGFDLPKLITRQHMVAAKSAADGFLFDLPAVGLAEQRKERSRTVTERCEMAAEIANATPDSVVSWCHLNREGDLLTKLIPDAVQVSGADSDERTEEVFQAFAAGQIRVLVTKPVIAGMGLNWQHCNRQTFFPSHSFEQWYQAIRRSWRFGQKRPVTIDVITTEGEANVLANLKRKAVAAERMSDQLIRLMNQGLVVRRQPYQSTSTNLPPWLH